MHVMAFAVAPEAPSGLVAAQLTGPARASLTWVDNSLNETGFTIQRATDDLFTLGLTSFTVPSPTTAYMDTTIVDGTVYFYRVFANNVVGDVDTPGFPTQSADSAFSNTAQLGTLAVPGAPTTLAALAVSSTEVDLTWVLPTPSSPIVSFRVERSTDGGVTWPTSFAVANPLAVAYNDIAAAPAIAYAYRVFAVNAAGDSLPSNVATVTTPNGTPFAPTGLTAVAANGRQVNLAWVAGVGGGAPAGFRVERSTDGGATWPVNFVIANPAALSYSDVTALPLTAYAYRVFATNALGDSPASNTATVTTPDAVPLARVTLTAPLVTGSQVNLAWVNPADTATITGFRVERSTDGGVTFPVQFVMAGTAITTYNDTLVSPLTAYMYRVFAFNAMGNSPASNTVSVTTPAGIPNPPMSLSAVAVSGVQVNLTWQAPVGGGAPASYRIERSANGGGTWPVSFVIASPATLAFSDTTVAPLTAYAYRIFAVNGSGDSLPSNIATVTTLGPPPNAPSNLTAVLRLAGRRVLLNWRDNSNNENGFYIERMPLGGAYSRPSPRSGGT